MTKTSSSDTTTTTTAEHVEGALQPKTDIQKLARNGLGHLAGEAVANGINPDEFLKALIKEAAKGPFQKAVTEVFQEKRAEEKRERAERKEAERNRVEKQQEADRKERQKVLFNLFPNMISDGHPKCKDCEPIYIPDTMSGLRDFPLNEKGTFEQDGCEGCLYRLQNHPNRNMWFYGCTGSEVYNAFYGLNYRLKPVAKAFSLPPSPFRSSETPY